MLKLYENQSFWGGGRHNIASNCDLFCDALISSQTHIFYIYTYTTRIPQGSIAIICVYHWAHLYGTAGNRYIDIKDQCLHDLHELAERRSTFVTIYKF